MLPGILKIRKKGKTSEFSLPDFDFEYKLWKNKLGFMSQQLALFLQRLKAIKVEYSHEKNIKKVDPAISMIITVKENIKQLLIQIRTQEEEISHYVKDFPINSKHEYYRIHNKLKEEMIGLQKDYESLNKFLQVNVGNLLFI